MSEHVLLSDLYPSWLKDSSNAEFWCVGNFKDFLKIMIGLRFACARVLALELRTRTQPLEHCSLRWHVIVFAYPSKTCTPGDARAKDIRYLLIENSGSFFPALDIGHALIIEQWLMRMKLLDFARSFLLLSGLDRYCFALYFSMSF